MSSAIEGSFEASDLKFAVVCSKFNAFVTDRLLAGALDALKAAGAPADAIAIVRVPGSWELALVAKTLAQSKRYDAIIALGAVIRGETAHFDYVAGQAAAGLRAVQQDTGVPVAFGVLTTNNIEQAMDRAGGKVGNKGYDAAATAVEMASLLRSLRK